MRGAAELAEEAQGPPLENTTFPACANGQGGGGHEQQPLRPQGEARLGTKTRGPLEKHHRARRAPPNKEGAELHHENGALLGNGDFKIFKPYVSSVRSRLPTSGSFYDLLGDPFFSHVASPAYSE